MRDLEERFANALCGTARTWRQALDRRLKHLGVSQASWATMEAAANAVAPLSQSELAERLAVEGATMVAMIDRLVSAGLVVREPSTTDRRVKRVVVTAAGQRLYDTVQAAAALARKELLASFDRHQLEEVILVLDALHEKLGGL
jgi:MarR family transcriptional regulator for hemolysin